MRLRVAFVLLVGLCSVAPIQTVRAAPPDSIATNRPTDLDASIDARLEAIFAELSELAEVEVEVRAGVVHLSGQVLELETAEKAEDIAGRIDGVIAVDNDIEQIHTVERRIQPLIDTLERRALELWSFLPLFVVGMLIILAAWALARLLARSSKWSAAKSKGNSFVRGLVGQLVRAGVIVLGVVLALELMGATTLIGAVLGTAGVVGLALGFAFKDTAENYIASILLSVRKPFEPNDLIEVEGHTGRVVRLTSRATILLTLDGNHVRIPNAVVFKATIINYTRNPQRRFSFELGVAVEAELSRVQALAIETIAATPGVLTDPAPTCLVEGFGDSAMLISIGGWIDQREADWFKVGSEARRRIKVAFEQAGIDVPEPIFRVRTRSLDEQPTPAATTPPATKAPSEPAASTADVSPDRHLIDQVASERAESGDLLNADAPVE